ncbi:TetR-like C-terminal domain-containing protein [Devosia sp. FJ2-5-3]|uniref:TetR/AcrR family transcriptional regulator n=1 Tax=Devosia sp. FJ2-5-3 TaxID=2976680 RepID=UPI0023D89FFE|nr:TetR-like C-terminal domain-containing protein [Devosia sp. FJ2-5-3]WEJ57398.1 TetR family transcriptional regulator C-terminal domain-containing protein [Devosia sp. FJ2-5-3]
MSEIAQPETDPRFIRTHKSLLEALIALVDADPGQPISITRLVETAGVTRPTFYQHFADVGAALQEAALERVAAAYPSFVRHDDGRAIVQQVYDHILPPLQHLHDHRQFYLRVIQTAASASLFEALVRLVQERMQRHPPQSDNDLSDVIAAGAMWLVVRWLRGSVDGSPRDIARRIATLAPLLQETEEEEHR